MKSKDKLLFEAIKYILPNTPNFKIMDNDMPIDASNPVINTCALYFKSGITDTRRELDKLIVSKSKRLVVNVLSELGNIGLENGRVFCEEFVNTVLTLANFSYTDTDGNTVTIIKTSINGGDYNNIGRNEQGIPSYSINFNIEYK